MQGMVGDTPGTDFAADGSSSFQNENGQAVTGEDGGATEPAGACADDDNVKCFHGHDIEVDRPAVKCLPPRDT